MSRGTSYEDQHPDDTRYRDGGWLYEQYVEEERSQSDLSSECGVSTTTIQKWLRKHEIYRPGEFDGVACGLCDRSFRSKEGWFSHVTQVHEGTEEERKAREWISEENPNADGLSEEQRKNLSESLQGREITEEQREKISESLSDYYDENGFTESQKEWHETCKGEENPAKQEWFSKMMSGENNPAKRPEVRQKISENNPMKDAEVVDGFTGKDNPMFGVTGSDHPASEANSGEDNPMKRPEVVKKAVSNRDMPSGKDHYNWDGGCTLTYGDDWKEKRRLVRERDDFTCQQCGTSEEDIPEEKYYGELDVHHIVPFREFEDKKKANKLDNLVSLCRSCHREVE